MDISGGQNCTSWILDWFVKMMFINTGVVKFLKIGFSNKKNEIICEEGGRFKRELINNENDL